MNVPAELRYSKDHEWTRLEASGRVRVGITDYAQDALGDVVFVELPATGTVLASGDTFGEVESTKSVSDLFAPLGGTVVEINDMLTDAPEKLNEDPYGEGWICLIEPDDPAQLDLLLDASAYSALIES
ncbi:MAG: glycine cleavage system protein GcvH [Acidimicrobiales bacterium]